MDRIQSNAEEKRGPTSQLMFSIDEGELEKSLTGNTLNRTLGAATKFRSRQAGGAAGMRRTGTQESRGASMRDRIGPSTLY